MAYQHILLALELENSDQEPILKALAMMRQSQAKLTLIHSIEHISSYGAVYGVTVGTDIEEVLMKNAVQRLAKVGEKIGVAKTNQLVKFGPAKFVILEEAERLGADLIVVGSHGKHGIRLLLGSTANAILHTAQCDVLAVRLKHTKK